MIQKLVSGRPYGTYGYASNLVSSHCLVALTASR